MDTLLVPFWQDPRAHPITHLAEATTMGQAAKHLSKVVHIGDLGVMHTLEYLAGADDGRRLRWSTGRLSHDQACYGTNCAAWLRLVREAAGNGEAFDETDLLPDLKALTARLSGCLPTKVSYASDNGERMVFKWRQAVNNMVVQASTCVVIKTLQAWLTGHIGNHGRKTRAAPEWVKMCPRRVPKRQRA